MNKKIKLILFSILALLAVALATGMISIQNDANLLSDPEVEFTIQGPYDGMDIISAYSRLDTVGYLAMLEDTIYQKKSKGDGFCLLRVNNKSNTNIQLPSMVFEDVIIPADIRYKGTRSGFSSCGINRGITKIIPAKSEETIICMIPKGVHQIQLVLHYYVEGSEECLKQRIEYIKRNSVFINKNEYDSKKNQQRYDEWIAEKIRDPDSIYIKFDVNFYQKKEHRNQAWNKLRVYKLEMNAENPSTLIGEARIESKSPTEFKFARKSSGIYQFSKAVGYMTKFELCLTGNEDFIYLNTYNEEGSSLYKAEILGLQTNENDQLIEFAKKYRQHKIKKEEIKKHIGAIDNPLLAESAFLITRDYDILPDSTTISILRNINNKMKKEHPLTFFNSRTINKLHYLTIKNSGINIGGKAPDYTFFTKDSTLVNPTELNSKLVLLYFWSATYEPDSNYNKMVVELNKKYNQKELTTIAICGLSRPPKPEYFDEKIELWNKKIIENGMETLINAHGYNIYTSFPYSLFEVNGLPHFILLKNGKVIFKEYKEFHRLLKLIEEEF